MNYKQACLKRDIEFILVAPFVFFGKLLGLIFPLKKKNPIFLFFPSDGIGGATKVNADILELFISSKPAVIFSKKYNNNAFAKHFDLPNANIIDLRNRIDNKWLYFINIIYRGILSTWINNADDPIVFGGESIYFYKVIPYLKKSARTIELSHLNTWLNYNQAFVKYIDTRITSTPKLKRDIETQYLKNNVPKEYLKKLIFIDNWVDIPEYKSEVHQDLRILFVGRGSPQKRVYLISQVAEKIIKHTGDIHFTFVGDVTNLLSEFVLKHAKVYENISDKNLLYDIYNQSDILILTSAFEGLPIVVMDMMARGKVVLSTAVDGIPDYVVHHDTGLLIKEVNDEEKIVDEAVKLIYEMNSDRKQLEEIGNRAYLFARDRFLKSKFEERYRFIFTNDENK
jgi:L-malate glycosyltransferase